MLLTSPPTRRRDTGLLTSRRRTHHHAPRVEFLEGRTLLSAGDLDPTFGTGGIVTTSFSGTSRDMANEVLVQPDGKVVAVGTNMARYNANGTLDPSFGKGGKVASANAEAAALYPVGTANAGKIVAVGSISGKKTGSDFALTRYNTNGSVDSTFGSGGKVTTDFSGGSDGARAVVVQPDGKVVVAGESTYRTPSGAWRRGFALARYSASGALDTSFGSGGKVITEFLAADVHDMTLLPDGRIAVVARAVRPDGDGNFIFTVVRYNANGSLDTTFGPDHTGIVQVFDMLADHPGVGSAWTTGTIANEAYGVTAQADGKIIAVGSTYGNNDGDGWLIARFDTAGNLDNTFGIRGTTFLKPSGRIDSESAQAVAVQADGKIVVAGGTDTASGFYVTRLDTTGTVDGAFGTGGIVRTVLGSGNQARDVAVQADGKIIVSGDAPVGSSVGFGLARYLGSSSVSLLSFSRTDRSGNSKVRVPIPLQAAHDSITADRSDGWKRRKATAGTLGHRPTTVSAETPIRLTPAPTTLRHVLSKHRS